MSLSKKYNPNIEPLQCPLCTEYKTNTWYNSQWAPVESLDENQTKWMMGHELMAHMKDKHNTPEDIDETRRLAIYWEFENTWGENGGPTFPR